MATQMRYRLLGKSGVRVTELALGTMTFGDDWGWGAPKDEACRIFEAYVEAGKPSTPITIPTVLPSDSSRSLLEPIGRSSSLRRSIR
jgi:hypothetical protein